MSHDSVETCRRQDLESNDPNAHIRATFTVRVSLGWLGCCSLSGNTEILLLCNTIQSRRSDPFDGSPSTA
ncbi:unnamed protein product [Zymoseptoria tritici ST99CH_3D7]|uniref:Uncharacterized protein n=1 Tax=Zymoseptoria tritici (strain ST99CH_3D7) TaxID=1276538 RepID=A0A1X7RNI3_ZYMT9|nr:unnamed protein product [Zymoseptoria tritici ST99CH_3D7]